MVCYFIIGVTLNEISRVVISATWFIDIGNIDDDLSVY